MTKEEKNRRINQAIGETKDLLIKAFQNYENSVKVLKMDIQENKELGNDKKANMPWVEKCNEYKKEIQWLKSHISKLETMLVN